MKGLIMLGEYLEEILNGEKTCDVRMQDTEIRGKIALIDTRKSKIIGFAELTDTHEISPKEYALWHLTGKWEDDVFRVDRTKKYYAYELENPERIAVPLKVEKNGKVWCDIPDELLSYASFQDSLF